MPVDRPQEARLTKGQRPEVAPQTVGDQPVPLTGANGPHQRAPRMVDPKVREMNPPMDVRRQNQHLRETVPTGLRRRMKVDPWATAPPMVKAPQTVSGQIPEKPMVRCLRGAKGPHQEKTVTAPPSRPMVPGIVQVRVRMRSSYERPTHTWRISHLGLRAARPPHPQESRRPLQPNPHAVVASPSSSPRSLAPRRGSRSRAVGRVARPPLTFQISQTMTREVNRGQGSPLSQAQTPTRTRDARSSPRQCSIADGSRSRRRPGNPGRGRRIR